MSAVVPISSTCRMANPIVVHISLRLISNLPRTLVIVGTYDNNPNTNTMVYDVEFPDGEVK